MISEPRHRTTGEPLGLVIAQYPGELDIDAVGIWQIVPGGQGNFGLSGDALTEFVRKAIYALLDAGAVPVRHEPGSGYEWVRQQRYGISRDDIAEAVIKEWLSVPDDPIELISQCPWFARPNPDFPNYVKMD